MLNRYNQKTISSSSHLDCDAISLILLAAGESCRFGKGNKLLAPLDRERTVLEASLLPFTAMPSIEKIIVVTSPALYNRAPIAKHPLITHTVLGGTTRFQSLSQGLTLATSPWALIHDAARPLLTQNDLKRLLDSRKLDSHSAAFLGAPQTNSLRRVGSQQEVTELVSRKNLWNIFTPQLYKTASLKKAVAMAEEQGVDPEDETELMFSLLNEPAKAILAYSPALKITYFSDLLLAQHLFQQRQRDGSCETWQ